jgi:RNA polymerase-binding transcription factor DksA
MKRSTQELLVRKNELLKRLAAIRGDLANGLASDSEEQALQLQNFEVLQEIERLANKELMAIEEELSQLDEDS